MRKMTLSTRVMPFQYKPYNPKFGINHDRESI
jgi:hypothetical protein